MRKTNFTQQQKVAVLKSSKRTTIKDAAKVAGVSIFLKIIQGSVRSNKYGLTDLRI